ncbi:MAG: hypothetical protein BGN96_08490 [Bacteroidales bacterium 45-6]|nr:MAG: hypothetical protein BGN96_08490 [Bacteroidales bacterium 45-6]
MKRIITIIVLLVLLKPCVEAQNKGFTLEGCIPGMKDGIVVALLSAEDNERPTLAEDTVRNGCFKLRGSVPHPTLCTLITNNLENAPKTANGEQANIHWTYTDVFVDNAPMRVVTDHYDSIPVNEPVTKHFAVEGGKVQEDFNTYNRMLLTEKEKGKELSDSALMQLQIKFIHSNPQSAMSVVLANNLLQGAYRLQREQILDLQKAITSVPDDTIRLAEFRKNSALALRSAVNSDLVNLPLFDLNGKSRNLTEVIPKGKYVLIDFWASWCSICLMAIPDIKKVAARYPDNFAVVGISADTNLQAWKNSIKKEKLGWEQYLLTPEGLKGLKEKYLVAGVPYYLIVDPQGKVVNSPVNAEDITKHVNQFCK